MRKIDASDGSISHERIEFARAKRPQILVVEDDSDLRAVVRDILQDEGFSVVEAGNGSAALDYLLGTETLPSLILLDMNMPIMSGREMLSVLRGYLRFSTIPVLVVTSEVPSTQSPEEGTVGRLQKPFGAQQLLSRVLQHRARTR